MKLYTIIENDNQLNHTYLEYCMWEEASEYALEDEFNIQITGDWDEYPNLGVRAATCTYSYYDTHSYYDTPCMIVEKNA